MTTQASQALPGWSELLFRSMAKLRELFDSALDCLDPDTTDDFSHLFEGGRRLEKMLGEPESKDSNHDLMNVLAAIRGYAEMLREDLGTEQANMDEALSHLLEAVHAAKFSDLETSSAREIELRKAREAELSKQVAPY